MQKRKDAKLKEEQQYRPSTAIKVCLGESDNQECVVGIPVIHKKTQSQKKQIQEDYTMFDEVKDDDLLEEI